MKRRLFLVMCIVAVLGVGAAVLENARRPEWTTASPEALAEFRMAMDALMKLYHAETREHLERALQLDPGFVMARVVLAQERALMGDTGALDELRELVENVDLARLNPRERFLVRLTRARLAGDQARVDAVVSAYLERHPEDPYALEVEARTHWNRGELQRARELFTRLVEVSPNWVVGYNSLGYICMEQGEFDRAEEYFSTYRFIAPDQANPYDSTGELFILTGRWEEARENLLEAIQIKPDFCASHQKLILVDLLLGDEEAAREALARLETIPSCAWMVPGLRCRLALWPLSRAHRWREILETADTLECSPQGLTVHRAAAFSGDLARCEAMEEAIRKKLDGMDSPLGRAIFEAQLEHMAGIRAAAAGDWDTAKAAFLRADALLTWRGVDVGFLKLINLESLAEVHLASGNPARADATLRTLRRVNPPLARRFEENTYRPLGLEEHTHPADR